MEPAHWRLAQVSTQAPPTGRTRPPGTAEVPPSLVQTKLCGGGGGPTPHPMPSSASQWTKLIGAQLERIPADGGGGVKSGFPQMPKASYWGHSVPITRTPFPQLRSPWLTHQSRHFIPRDAARTRGLTHTGIGRCPPRAPPPKVTTCI